MQQLLSPVDVKSIGAGFAGNTDNHNRRDSSLNFPAFSWLPGAAIFL